MNKIEIAYIPIGVPTFHLESAGEEFKKSINLLHGIDSNIICPDEMLLTMDKLKNFCDKLSPNLLIIQNITFANSAYMSEILRRFDCQVVLWTLREPVIDGGRLRLNSLTGAYSAANALHAFGNSRFQYVFGSTMEERVKKAISASVNACKVKEDLRNLKMVAIGHIPDGFGFGRALDSELLSTFGVTLESIEARELFNKARSYTDEEIKDSLEEANEAMVGLEDTVEENKLDFGRLYKAYSEYIVEHDIGAASSRCWPDFFTDYGTPPCSVIAMLNDKLKVVSCETDTYGALTMYIGSKFTGRSTYFGDPVSLDEDENTITFWHCGTAACSLANEDTGPLVGVHPNRKIGPAMDFGTKPWDRATIFRVGRKPDGSFRFFITRGEILDKPKQFTGTSLVIKTDNLARDIVEASVKDGWEPHYAVVYGDIRDELHALADMLCLEVCEY